MVTIVTTTLEHKSVVGNVFIIRTNMDVVMENHIDEVNKDVVEEDML